MTDRRSILSTLCAGALAPLAPVAALAGKRREVDASYWGMPARQYIENLEKSYRLVLRQAIGHLHELGAKRKECAELRTLLAEARDVLTPVVPFKRKDGTYANFTQVHANNVDGLVQRINAALGEREARR